MSSKFKLIGSSLMFRFKKKSVIKYTYAQWNKTMIFFSLNEIIYVWGAKATKGFVILEQLHIIQNSLSSFELDLLRSKKFGAKTKASTAPVLCSFFLDFIIRSGGIRAFFCSQKVLSISWKGCALAREFMVQTVFSGTPFNGFLTQGHLTFFLIWRIGRGCVRAYQNKSEIKWHSLSLSNAQSVFCGWVSRAKGGV